jgi:hypothetical protein
MENIIYIQHWTRKYPVIISKTMDPELSDMKTTINVECKEAWFNQVRDITDLTWLIEYLPELIEERRQRKKQNTINLRITSEEKAKIEALAKQNWYSSVSSYIRDKALVIN